MTAQVKPVQAWHRVALESCVIQWSKAQGTTVVHYDRGLKRKTAGGAAAKWYLLLGYNANDPTRLFFKNTDSEDHPVASVKGWHQLEKLGSMG